MTRFRCFVYIILLQCCVWFIRGQSCEFVVIDSISKQVIPYADFQDLKSSRYWTADDRGHLIIEEMRSDSLELAVFAFGYQLKEVIVDVSDLNGFAYIKLNRLSRTLNTVQITATRKDIFRIRKLRDTEDAAIFAGKRNEVVLMDLVQANKAGAVARQIFGQVTGLNIYEGNDGGLQLNIGGRGLDPNRSSNFNMRQNSYDISADVLGYPESYYSPPPEGVQEIQIIRGASSLQYGSQFGGLVNFKLRELPKHYQWGLKANQSFGSFGLRSSFVNPAYNSKKLSVNAYINYKRGEGYREFSDFESIAAWLKLEYRISEVSRIEAEYSVMDYLAQQAGGLTDLQFSDNPRQSTRERNWFDINWNLLNLKYQRKLANRSTFVVSLFALLADRKALGFRGNPVFLNENPILSEDERSLDGGYILPRDALFSNFKNWGSEVKYLKYSSLCGKKVSTLIGAKYYHASNLTQQGQGLGGVDPVFVLSFGPERQYPNSSFLTQPNRNLAVFAESIFYLGAKWKVIPGLRYEHIVTANRGEYVFNTYDNSGNIINSTWLEENQRFQRSFLLLGLGMEYQLSKDVDLLINLTENYRSVTFSDLRVVNPGFVIDPDLTDETGFTMDIGARGKLGDYISFDISAYWVRYANRIGLVLDDRANRKRTNVGSANILGLESLIEMKPLRLLKAVDQKEWDLSVLANVSFVDARYVSSLQANVADRGVEFVPARNLKLTTQAAYRNFGLSVQWTSLSSQWTDAQNSLVPDPSDRRFGLIGAIPAYQIWDVDLTWDFGPQFKLSTGVNNALGANYFTRRATGYPGPGIIPSDGRNFYVSLEYTVNKLKH